MQLCAETVMETKDVYEKALTIYALLLASQDKEVLLNTNGKYIEVGLSFDKNALLENEEVVALWWETYKDIY